MPRCQAAKESSGFSEDGRASYNRTGGVALARERLWLGTARASSGALRAAPRGSLGGPQRVVPERRANEHRYWPAACRAAKTVMGPQPVGRVSAARSARSLSHSHACTER